MARVRRAKKFERERESNNNNEQSATNIIMHHTFHAHLESVMSQEQKNIAFE